MWYPAAGTAVPYLRNCGTHLLEQWCNFHRNLQQLKKEIEKLPIGKQKVIKVTTYQKLEELLSNAYMGVASFGYVMGYANAKRINYQTACYELESQGLFNNSLIYIDDFKISSFHCVVCDECHYFLADSNFNTNTILSYNFVKHHFSDKIRIYISATIQDIKYRILCDEPKYMRTSNFPVGVRGIKMSPKIQTTWYNIDTPYFNTNINLFPSNQAYSTERNYDYIDIGIVGNNEEIVDLIFSNEGRWLIFVDSKSLG